MKMKIATWNVNSINNRKDHVVDLLDSHSPDILCLQETRCLDYPEDLDSLLDSRGYKISHKGRHGGRNGVAIISNQDFSQANTSWVDFDGRMQIASFTKFSVVNLYVPQGGNIESPNYDYKLTFLSDLYTLFEELSSKPIIVVGDLNLVSSEMDSSWPLTDDDTCSSTLVRREFWKWIIDLGFKDTWRTHNIDEIEYTHFDYRNGHFPKNLGMRLDYILASKEFNVLSSSNLIDFRKRTSPSDHVPVISEVVLR
jgi:exodeoxyribonuclease-3